MDAVDMLPAAADDDRTRSMNSSEASRRLAEDEADPSKRLASVR
jgi:hypothetical protein